MSTVSSEQILLQAQRSAELVAVFKAIAEMDVDGESKFSRATCHELGRMIVCRSYAPAVLELCCLLFAACACDNSGQNRYERLFWESGLARAGYFKGFLDEHLKSSRGTDHSTKMTNSGIEILFPEGTFIIHFSRMPVLSSLMEFLISTISYPILDDLFCSMLEQEWSKKSASSHASTLSKLVYEYLKNHLPTALNQRKFRRLIEVMEQRFRENFSADHINDEIILDVWRSESLKQSGDGLGFKTFQNVFLAFVHFRRSLDEARSLKALDSTLSIGSDRDAGEVSPDVIGNVVQAVEEERNTMKKLLDPPINTIKFLNKKESETVDLLFVCGVTALRLPLSLMRCMAFDAAQNLIIQALRDKLNGEQLTSFINNSTHYTYLDHQSELDRVLSHIDRMLFASLHVLLNARDNEAIALILILEPDIDLSPLREWFLEKSTSGDNVVFLDSQSMAKRFIAFLEDKNQAGPALSTLTKQAKKTFRGISRQGFKKESMAENETVLGFAEGSKALVEIKNHVSAFCRSLEQGIDQTDELAQRFEADREIFSRHFHKLYGDMS